MSKVLSFACERLGINDVTIVASCNDKLLRKLSQKGDTDFSAVLFKSSVKYIYNLYLKPNLRLSTFVEIICHEAIHLMQQERGDLSLNLTTGECRWRGGLFTADYPYMERPWEREAFKEQADLIRAYWKMKKKEKKKNGRD